MVKLAIIHFNPIELYPPVMNWVNFLGEQEYPVEVKVFSMKVPGIPKSFQSKKPFIDILRSGNQKSKSIILRYWSYFLFYAKTTFTLLWWRPDTLMYYETYSSLPAVLYHKLAGRRPRLFIHYHEYTSPEDYLKQGKFYRLLHKLERIIYPVSQWLSHTNQERMQLFLKDNQDILIPHPFILPNYPPRSWKPRKVLPVHTTPLKIVYIGALSLETMYVKEFIDWVLQQKGEVIFDIYSSNCTEDAKAYLQSMESDLVHLYEGVDYFSLPEILAKYDIGVILYKGHLQNYIYNAPNKLFEYLACGLDVWFPDILVTTRNYVTTDSYPKVISIRFSELDQFRWQNAVERDHLDYKPSVFYCDGVFDSLWRKIMPQTGLS
ncbi:MAG TPA: hypothetical protein VKR32_13170 [Puia sp.]|nr:hypothetical protein [Puia sp.]